MYICAIFKTQQPQIKFLNLVKIKCYLWVKTTSLWVLLSFCMDLHDIICFKGCIYNLSPKIPPDFFEWHCFTGDSQNVIFKSILRRFLKGKKKKVQEKTCQQCLCLMKCLCTNVYLSSKCYMLLKCNFFNLWTSRKMWYTSTYDGAEQGWKWRKKMKFLLQE